MQVLVLTNKINNKINPAFNNLLGAVKALGGKCDAIIVGYDLKDVAEKVSKYERINQVITIDHIGLENILAENIAPQLSQICKKYTHVLIAADSFGKNLLPRIAGILEIGQISEVIGIKTPSIFKKFIYAGNVLVELESLEQIKLLSIRANNFPIDDEVVGAAAPINSIEYSSQISDKIKFISKNIVDNSVDLGSAKIVVSGGISLDSRESFDSHIRPLAKKLNAAVGATRAAVEAGYANNDTQVGQTGVSVAPELYIAVGISGAVQHIAGMKDSKTVIAINSDATAPIFDHADYGLVGNLFEIVPSLISKL